MIDAKILAALKSQRQAHVSGEELSRAAGVSRSAIWKHIESLRGEGYEIEATPHLGYRLLGVPDRLVANEIMWQLKTNVIGKNVISYATLGSTNITAYDLAQSGVAEGTVVVAEEQTRGKGRLGRSWSSPANGGIYLSCILRPLLPPGSIAQLTLASSVAVAKAIRDVTGVNATIKWPNDVVIGRRKVSGILLEMKADQDSLDFVVVGIGINANTPVRLLPAGAASLSEEARHDITRVRLVQRVLELLDLEYERLLSGLFESVRLEWKSLTDMLGSRIKVTLPRREFEGQAVDLDTDGCLLIRLDNGFIERASSGDVLLTRRI